MKKSVNLSISNKLISNLKNNKFFGSPVHIVLIFLFLFLIFRTIMYLNELETCECFKNDDYKSNITFLKIFEGIVAISLLVTLFIIYKTHKQTGGGNNTFVHMITILITTLFHFFVAFNIFQLYKKVDKDCECSSKLERYYLYYQGIGSSVTLISNLLMFLTLIGITATVAFKKYVK